MLSQLSGKPPLPKPQQRRLIERAQAGDRQALEILTEHNLRLVTGIAGRFCRRSGRDFEDAVSDGLMGLARAIRNYDLARGTAFSTFAWPYIENSMKWDARPAEISIDQVVRGTDEVTLLDTLPDTSPGPEDKVLNSDLREQIEQALDVLTDRERTVVTRLYGLDGSEVTPTELAREMGLSVSRVTNLHRAALLRLNRKGFND